MVAALSIALLGARPLHARGSGGSGVVREAELRTRNILVCGGGNKCLQTARLVRGNVRAAATSAEREGEGRKQGPCIVWFKHDLRTDDHPGLLAASSYEAVVPVYVFDPALLAGWPASLLQSLHDAVVHLQQELQLIGSDLVVRIGNTADVVAELAQETGAVDVVTEEEVEQVWQQAVTRVSDGLARIVQGGKVASVKHWTASLYESEHAIPVSFQEFERLKILPSRPVQPPATLPALPHQVDKGAIPNLRDISDSTRQTSFGKSISSQLQSATDVLRVDEAFAKAPKLNGGPFRSFLDWREKYILASPYAALEKNAWPENDDYWVAGGAAGAVNALNGYLRFLEPTASDDWQRMYEHVWALETRPGASFRSLFGSSLTLGTLSLRRVYQEAIEYEKARLGGRLSPFGFSTFTVAAAVADAKSIEWYRRLAKRSQGEEQARGLSVKTWKWRDFLVQYSHAGDEGPAVVLVHGFGAFSEHYRDNLKGLAQRETRVWALTLLGFGRSEKPNVLYTELFWSELVRDFIVEVVKEPVVLAGNSIGGYIVSVVAGLWPDLVKSLVLINSAGKIAPNWNGLRYRKPKDKSQLAWAGARLLMLYLQSSSTKLLQRCYPVNTARADSWLAQEVTRASYDPGAMAVLESIFFLRAPLPLNYFLDRFGGKVLAIQGAKDPLMNSSLKASLFKTHCKNVVIKFVEAGHCPHDEVPDQVNAILENWITASAT